MAFMDVFREGQEFFALAGCIAFRPRRMSMVGLVLLPRVNGFHGRLALSPGPRRLAFAHPQVARWTTRHGPPWGSGRPRISDRTVPAGSRPGPSRPPDRQ